jgi:hypothetical protein
MQSYDLTRRAFVGGSLAASMSARPLQTGESRNRIRVAKSGAAGAVC